MFSLIHYEFFSHAKSYQNKERKTALNSLLEHFYYIFYNVQSKKSSRKLQIQIMTTNNALYQTEEQYTITPFIFTFFWNVQLNALFGYKSYILLMATKTCLTRYR